MPGRETSWRASGQGSGPVAVLDPYDQRPAGSWARGLVRLCGVDIRLNSPAVPVVALTLAALALRFIVPRGLWGDEAISVDEARMGFGQMIHYLRTEDVHPPLYFIFLWADVRLFGSGPLAVRLPSILAGTLMVPMGYLAAKACLDRRAGYIAAVLASVAPLMVWYSQEARMYAFYMLFALVALWAQVRCLQDGRWRYWTAFVLASAALFYNEYFGLMQVLAQWSAFVAFIWFRRNGAEARQLCRRAAVAAGCFVALLLPLMPYAYQQLVQSAGHPLNGVATGTGAGGGGSLSIYQLLAVLNWALWGYHSNATMADLNALWPVIMLIVLLLLGRGVASTTALVAWCIAVPLGLLFTASIYQRNLFDIRYAASVVPMLVVLASLLLARITVQTGTTIVATGLLVLVSVIALVDQQYDWGNPRLFDFDHTVAWITHRFRPGDLVEYGPDGIGAVMQYYAGSIPTQLAAPGAGTGAPRLFLLIAPPLYGTDTTSEAVTIYDASRGRRLVGRYRGANVDVWEFQ